MHLLLPKWFPLFILASSVCWSLQCLISALSQGGGGGHSFRLTSSVVLRGGRSSANRSHWRVWGALAVPGPHWVCPAHGACIPGLHCSGSRLLCRELSDAGPGLHALPRSKPLSFRFSGTPQRRRLGWAFVLCPSHGLSISGDQVLGEHNRPQVKAASYRLPCPSLSVFWVHNCRAFSGVSLLRSWSLAANLPEDVDHPESKEVSISNKVCLQFGGGCLSGAAIVRDCPLPALAALACLAPAGDGPVHSRLTLLSPLSRELSGPGGVLG